MTSRHAGIDFLKIICAQLIVLHHAVSYAPDGLQFALHWPRLSAFLLEPGRWVVHVFLVIGGFLSMQALERTRGSAWVRLVWQRYLRLMPMFALAVGLTLVMAWWVRGVYAPGFISSWSGWLDLLAHLSLTFDLWGVPAISAGAWYVAIDLQLFALLAWLVLVFGRPNMPGRASWFAPLLALTVVLATVVFSRQPWMDVYAPYFWGSYGLGCLVALAQGKPAERQWWWLAGSIVALDLWLDWRDRQGLALASAVCLWLWPALRAAWCAPRWLAQASDLSYALFVGHFSLLIGLGAWWTTHGPSNSSSPSSPEVALLYLTLAGVLAWGWAWGWQSLQTHSGFWLSRYLRARTRWA